MADGISRRHFFFGTLLAGVIPRVGFGSVPSLKALGYQSPNEKMNVAGIGAGGRAMSVLGGLESENIVALADVDWARGASGFQRWEKATRYKDYRKMLEKEAKNIDAVTVVTPDHMHATQALAAMQLGKHVYVEKPLTRTPWEARLLTDAAAKYKVATQMGNQGYSHEATRVAAEIIWSGEIGDVTEVHAFQGRAGWPEGMQKLPAPTPVPDTLDWDLWLGGAPWRPFSAGDDDYRAFVAARGGRGGGGGRGRGTDAGSAAPGAAAQPAPQPNGFYLPFNWRGFYDFGSSLIGDWGIHILGPANWALQLGSPISVECTKLGDGQSPFTFPSGGLAIKWEFAARGSMPPVTVYWSHMGEPYIPPGMTVEQMRQIPGTGPTIASAAGGRGRGAGAARGAAGAPGAEAGRGGRGRGGGGQQGSGYNQVFVGSKGYLGTSGRGEGVGLIPGKRWAEYNLPPQMLTRSPGHQRDWIRACKGGSPACSNFGIAGPYTEWVVLGAVAARVPGKLLWDPKKMEFTNNKDANKYVKPVFRKGWDIRLT
jgi:predicted dehydrogenase